MISVVVPAYNEEKALRRIVTKILRCAKAEGDIPVEIIIGNDGSTDGTARVAAELEKEFPTVRTVHHPTNLGQGATVLSALKIARYDRLAMLVGDDVIHEYTIREMFRSAYKADLICAYTLNTECRSPLRQFLSSLYGLIYTTTFGLSLRHVQVAPIYPVPLARNTEVKSRRYSFMAEMKVKLLRQGVTYLEIQGFMNPENQKSSALRLGNVKEVILTYLRLIYEIHFSKRELYSRRPKRVLPFEEPPQGP